MRISRRRMVAGLAAAPAGLALAQAMQQSGQAVVATPEPSPVASPTALPVTKVAQLTGAAPASINDTAKNYAVAGCDLGHTFLHGNNLYMIFGDTFDLDQTDWRSNCGAVLRTDQDPAQGLRFTKMFTDRPGHAKELLGSKKIDYEEMTVIPTYGVAVGNRLFLHYMSVKHWGVPGYWKLGAAGFAYSDDGGENWTKAPHAILPGTTNFGQVAMEKDGGFVYIYGIPGGRHLGAKLARVAEAKLLDLGSWEYWTGAAWAAGSEDKATLLIPAPVGELSVRFHPYYQRWIMMYLNEDRAAIVLRTAPALTGPWSDETVAVRAADYPALYAPYQLPLWNDGPDIWFTMSMFGPYEVFLMRTRL